MLRRGCIEAGRHPADRQVDVSQPMLHFARGKVEKETERAVGKGSRVRFSEVSETARECLRKCLLCGVRWKACYPFPLESTGKREKAFARVFVLPV